MADYFYGYFFFPVRTFRNDEWSVRCELLKENSSLKHIFETHIYIEIFVMYLMILMILVPLMCWLATLLAQFKWPLLGEQKYTVSKIL